MSTRWMNAALSFFILFVCELCAADIPTEALEADDECQSGDEVCAMNALQLRGVKDASNEGFSHKEGDEEAPYGRADDTDENEESEDETTPAAVENTNASLLQKPSYTPACFGYTGATCLTGSCDSTRHAACHNGKCVCAVCAGSDGRCYQHPNKQVASGIVLKNEMFPKYSLYFQRLTTFGQIKTTKSTWNFDQDKIDLFEIPGHVNGKRKYFMASTKWPEYVMGIKATTGTAFSPFGTYAVELEDKASIWNTWGTNNVMLDVCMLGWTSPYRGSLKFGATLMAGQTIHAYVHSGSYYVYGSISEPGTGGIWKPDPPIPEGTIEMCD